MPETDIVIRGAREHNLRNVSLTLPRNKLIVMTGVSGSGKSSLAFDTLYAEGQRRYVESLSSYARQFLGQMPKPEVDAITGLAPSISIQQKASGRNPRSTVGTITEIYDYLRVLFARVGQGFCPQCQREITAQTREQILESALRLPEGTRFQILAPVIQRQKGEYRDLFADLLKQGYLRARVDGRLVQLTDNLQLDRQMRHTIDVVVDRLKAGETARARLAEAIELALKLGNGSLILSVETDQPPAPPEAPRPVQRRRKPFAQAPVDAELPPEATEAGFQDRLYSSRYACTHCSVSYEPPSPQLFSFNSPQGMCPDCNGLGVRHDFEMSLLIPDPKLSLKKGAVTLLGPLKDIGRWRRHIFDGVARVLEQDFACAEGTLLDTPWEKLPEPARRALLYGTGERNITFSWKHRGGVWKHGGTFPGIVNELLDSHRKSRNPMRRRQLERYMRVVDCSTCDGTRLNSQARSVRITTGSDEYQATGKPLPLGLHEVCGLTIAEAALFFQSLQLDATGHLIAEEVLKEIRGRLGFLLRCGLDYLTLDRTAPTLSGGETQRIRLAGQIGCGLVGVVYILDEPSIGLHPRDNDMLLESLIDLRDQGNTVIVVEHDEETMRAADYLVDFGPGPGVRGGEVVAEGSLADVLGEPRSLTGQYLSGEQQIVVPEQRRPRGDKQITIVGARHNNLKNIDVNFPLESFICVTGVSGSGKSSLVNDILWEALNRDLNRGEGQPGGHGGLKGLEHLDKAINIDQSPIGRTPRSNPATYVKLFDLVRDLYTQLPDSKRRGYRVGRFSFNVAGGRCEACEGYGSTRLEMDFLADIWVTCPVCGGHRFNHETLDVRFKDKSIAEVLEMDVQQAVEHFENQPKIRRLVQTLHDVGLDYLKLGQPSPTLSGGEAQRIKLARELGKRSTGRTIYLLDEPTTGLHFADIHKLLEVLHGFVTAGNTVLVVEHNLDVIKTADWVIDLGPEGGAGGGTIVAQGTPEEIARCPQSHTGQALAKLWNGESSSKAASASKAASRVSLSTHGRAAGGSSNRPAASDELQRSIIVRGAAQHNLQHVDVEIPRHEMSVFCGPSGSGKSSLAMDTLYAEGQRRYVESLSSYARQFLGQMPKPRVEHIHGLSPAIAIEQKTVGHSPRSTVGTVTEIYDYLRIIFARLGQRYCPQCDVPVETQTTDQVIEKILQHPPGTRLLVMAPQQVEVGTSYDQLWSRLKEQGFRRVRVDGSTYRLEEVPEFDRRRKHEVAVVVDRVTLSPQQRSRLADSVESALDLGRGWLHLAVVDDDVPETDWHIERYSLHQACTNCGRSFEELGPNNFSFNSSLGWCPACEGLGVQQGTNLSVLVADPKRTLLDGAIAAWPDPKANALFASILEALAAECKVPLDVPFERLDPKHQRVILYGTGEKWIAVPSLPGKIQYKGLYPAVEEATRVSMAYRLRLADLVGEVHCSVCHGSRLREDAEAVRFFGQTLQQVCELPLGECLEFFRKVKLKGADRRIAGDLLHEVVNRLSFLVDVGLQYLNLGRTMPTLSGGESQRIRLAGQVGRALTGVLYVLDEPTIGLHPRDNTRLLGALQQLRDLGNTIILVEHDREVLEASDRLYDFGPGAGRFGGTIVAQGTPRQVTCDHSSLTADYLSGRKEIPIPTQRRMPATYGVDPALFAGAAAGVDQVSTPTAATTAPTVSVAKKTSRRRTRKTTSPVTEPAATQTGPVAGTSSETPLPVPPGGAWLEVRGARHRNLRNVDLRLPLGTLTCITGVSGSGKSSLLQDTLAVAVARRLHQARELPGAHEELIGLEHINKVIQVDQAPLGTTPASNPATYTGVFDQIRELYARLPDAKIRGYRPARFSFNRAGGRCEACEGNGQKCIEMHFLPDVWVECDTCHGRRFNAETLAVKYRGNSIADVLEMSIGQAHELFANVPKIRAILATLCAVGLDYLTLGQSAATLSGGEAQRVKLAAELARPQTGKTLYLLDEPTTGLHFEDIRKLLTVLDSLVERGNTVVVIEHNLDVIKTADWIVDLGPEAGDGGGWIVAQGTPEDIVAYAADVPAAVAETGRGKRTAKPASSGRQRPTQPDNGAPRLRSYTGELLGPILAASQRQEREVFDAAEAARKKEGDLDFRDLGREARMPWQTDGRQWHTVDRLSYTGKPCRWEGDALAAVIDAVEGAEGLSGINWNDRSVVEVTGSSQATKWFLHALTGDEWMLTLKFRVGRNVFKEEALQRELGLRSLDDLDELPVYGRGNRVRVKNLKSLWQEVTILVHWLREIDTPAFQSFLERALQSYRNMTRPAVANLEEATPWKTLGKKWHLSRKGFPSGKRVSWETDLLDQLAGTLESTGTDIQVDWSNRQTVVFHNGDVKKVWATLYTKRRSGVDLCLHNGPGQFALGRIAGLGSEREIVSGRTGNQQVKLRFTEVDQVHSAELVRFLKEHAQAAGFRR